MQWLFMDAILSLAFWNPLSDQCNNWGHLSEIVFINGVCDAFSIITCSQASSAGLLCQDSSENQTKTTENLWQGAYFSVMLNTSPATKTHRFNVAEPQKAPCALDEASHRFADNTGIILRYFSILLFLRSEEDFTFIFMKFCHTYWSLLL